MRRGGANRHILVDPGELVLRSWSTSPQVALEPALQSPYELLRSTNGALLSIDDEPAGRPRLAKIQIGASADSVCVHRRGATSKTNAMGGPVTLGAISRRLDFGNPKSQWTGRKYRLAARLPIFRP
jgi:hypothetical protein